MAHNIDDFPLPGIGRGRIKRLHDAGYHTLEQIVDAGPETLSQIPHLPRAVCQTAVDAAKQRLQQNTPPKETNQTPPEDETTPPEEPVAEPEEPVAEPEEPVAEPEEPVAESEDPVAESEDPVAESQDPVAEPEEPVAEPEEPVAEPEEPVAERILGVLDAVQDRVSASHRPSQSSAGRQSWHELLFVHWPIPVEALRPHIPKRLSIDTYDGVAYIGIVPFSMKGVQPWWAPFGMSFLETNVRTYVHLDGKDPGVWFFSLEAASWLAVQAARIGWSLPYHHAKMHILRNDGWLRYSSRRVGQPEATLSVDYTIGEALPPSVPGTLQHFLLERYYLYSSRGSKLYRGQVHHAPYPAHAVTVSRLEDGLVQAAGLPPVEGLPPIAHYSPGVDVSVYSLVEV